MLELGFLLIAFGIFYFLPGGPWSKRLLRPYANGYSKAVCPQLCTLINCVTDIWTDYLIYRCVIDCQLNNSVTDRKTDNLGDRLTNRGFINID